MLAGRSLAQFKAYSEIETCRRVYDANDVCTDLDNIANVQFCIALRLAVYCDASQCTRRNAHSSVFSFDLCMLQASSAVLQVQNLVRRSANGYLCRTNGPIVMFNAACRIPRNESDKVLHAVTST